MSYIDYSQKCKRFNNINIWNHNFVLIIKLLLVPVTFGAIAGHLDVVGQCYTALVIAA